MMRPIAHFLADFGSFGAAPPPSLAACETSAPDTDAADAAARHRAIEDARAAGARAGVAEAQAHFAAREAALTAEHEQRFAEARQLWAESETEALSTAFTDRLAALEERIAAAAAAVLEALLPRLVAAKAVEDLGAAIGALLASGEERAILVSGRADLVAALERAFPDQSAIDFTVSEAPDVTLRVGDTRIQSALDEWGTRLAADLGDAA